MDPVAMIVGLAGAGATAATANLMLEKLLGPTLDTVGEGIVPASLRTWKERRIARANEIVTQAAQALQDSGVEPHPVPGRILWPLLEAGSLEEDGELRRKWANLLAHAATPTGTVLPAFVEILRQLTSTQAWILDWMYSMKSEPVPGWVPHWPDVFRSDIEAKFALSPSDYALLITDMERLQLVEPRRDIQQCKKGTEYPMDQVLDMVVDRWNSRVKYDSINFTPLGVQFMHACTSQLASNTT